MPRTNLAIQEVSENANGVQVTGNAADQANGNMFENDGLTVLAVKNGDASSRTLTAVSVADANGRTGDRTLVVAAGEVGIIGPFTQNGFNQKSGTDQGKVYLDWSASTPSTVKITPVRLKK